MHKNPMRKHLVVWFVFSGLFALFPIAGSYIAILVASKWEMSDPIHPLAGGELLIISAIIVAAGIGDILLSEHIEVLEIIVGASCILLLFLTVAWYAAIVAVALTPSSNVIVGVTPPVAAYMHGDAAASEEHRYINSYCSVIVFICALVLGLRARMSGLAKKV